jgi:UDP-GlcNAc:undecaprenyl-phosphate GlcNAc-1-phosphate transferase
VPNQIRLEPLIALGWWFVALIAVGGGVAEDLTHRLTARWRLLFTVLAAALAARLLGLAVPSLGIATIDAVWGSSVWPGILLAVFAVAGLPHAFNLIDGYNGLAGIVAVICCFALAYVCLLVGDRQLAGVVLVLAGATAGFLLWNYPRGLIFAGDGGAYLWGVVIAVASVQLVQRHSQVSPWFPMLLLIYPVWETVFSIYRKLMRGQSPGVADALHFHQLIYRRIVREVFHDDEARRMLMRNNRTSPYLWGFTILTVIPAVLFWNYTPMLIAFTVLFIVSYVWAYISIIRFKVPSWLRH